MSFIALFLIGVFPRLLMLLGGKSFWSGEWEGIESTQGSLWQTLSLYTADTHPPAYFFLLHTLVRHFGINEVALRLPSFFAGCLVLLGLWKLAETLAGKKVAFAATAFAALSPYAIHLSHEVRSHGLLLCVSVFTAVFFFKKNMRAYTVTNLAGLYTHHFAWFTLTASLFFGRFKKTHALIVALASPVLFLFLKQCFVRNEWFGGWVGLEDFTVLSLLKEIFAVYWQMTVGYAFFMREKSMLALHLQTSPWFWAYAAFFVIIWSALILKIVKLFRSSRIFAAFLIFLIFIVPIGIGCLNPTRLDPKYFAFAVPWIWLLSVWSILDLKSSSFRIICFLLGLAVTLHGTIHLIKIPTDALYPEDYRAMSRYIFQNASEQDALMSNGLLEYYRKKLALPDKPVRIGRFDETMPSQLQKFERIWISDGEPVNSPVFLGIKSAMASHGYYPETREIIFGGHGSRAILNIFKRSSPTNPEEL